MNVQKYMRSGLVIAIAALLTLPAVHAQQPPGVTAKASYGTIVGLVTNSSNLPVARATVTANRADGGGIRATLSGSDGVYSFADLNPGTWSLTVQVDGYPEVTIPALSWPRC